MIRAQEIVDELRDARAPDPRLAVLDVRAEARGDSVALMGEVSDAALADELLARVAALPGVAGVVDEILRLPDADLGETTRALVRAALTPLYAVPDVAAPMVSQYVLGTSVEILMRRGGWWRVRGDDGYIGWVHHGYLETGARAHDRAWTALSRESHVSLGAELVDDESRTLVRLPWGARVLRDGGEQFLLPDGRTGRLGRGEVVAIETLPERFPPLPDRVTQTARLWLGAPYLWGGVTPAGADCSGFVQSVYWMHGVGLPRDSDMQARVGAPVPLSAGFSSLRAADLLFFAERPGLVSHVGMSLGGARMIHCSLSNGGAAIDDLDADYPIADNLRRIFVGARRLLPG